MEIETQNLRRGKRADAIVLGRVLKSDQGLVVARAQQNDLLTNVGFNES